jgi:hypothetical protein
VFIQVAAIAPCKLPLIRNLDFYDLPYKRTKMGLKIMDSLAQVVGSRLKAGVDYH